MGKLTISISLLQFHIEKCPLKSGLVQRASNAKSLVKLGRKMITDERYEQLQKKKQRGTGRDGRPDGQDN